jgi:hypothetical protein
MPSLIYIAEITRSSEELAKGLQSAGLHVKSFASGEITADECLLVMTAEAVLANLRPANVTPRAGHTAETSQEAEGAPPPSNLNAHLGLQAVIWNRLKTAAAKESAASTEEAPSFASKTEGETASLGFIPSEIRSQTLASPQKSETLQPLPAPLAALSARPGTRTYAPHSLPTEDKSRVSSAQTSAVSCGKALRPSGRSRLANVPRYSLLWQTVGIITSMLLFAAIRPSMTDMTKGSTNQSTRFIADSKEPTQTGSGRRSVTASRPSKPPVTPSSTGAAKTAEAQRYQANYGFVAEDFTNHFDPQAHSMAILQNSERKARGSVKPKRLIVVN